MIAQQGRVFKVIENVEKCGNNHLNRQNDGAVPSPLPGFFSFRQTARIRDKIIKEGITTAWIIETGRSPGKILERAVACRYVRGITDKRTDAG